MAFAQVHNIRSVESVDGTDGPVGPKEFLYQKLRYMWSIWFFELRSFKPICLATQNFSTNQNV